MRSDRLRLLIALLLAGVFSSLVPDARAQSKAPDYVNIGSLVTTWAVGQGVILNAVVVPSGTTTSVPTGTVQFLANGTPIGQPVLLAQNSFATTTIPFNVPGNYALTVTYSGDANFAPSTSTYDWTILVAVNPPSVLPTPSPASLTFAAGATTGNTVDITMTQINGCHCDVQWTTGLAVTPGTPTPGDLAIAIIGNGTSDSNGNFVYPVTINSVASHTVTEGKKQPKQASLLAAASILLLLMLLRRRSLQRVALAIAVLLVLPSLGGCAAAPTFPPVTELVPGSAGAYTLSITGEAFDLSSGDHTYFSTQVPITIQ